MRLLHRNGDGIEVVEFLGQNPPPYAVLSHRWGLPEDEVTFQDIHGRVGYYKLKPGYAKVAFCMNQAESDGIEYAWCDTCCIDKTNNTELAEAIRSMYRWYEQAEKCYAYLSDVPEKPFESSQWFNRGWTLQELLAPTIIKFYSSSYELLGTKQSLIEKIQQRTQLPREALEGCPLSKFSIEEKFSWIDGRQTQRPEDLAYCLHGIFDIYMPLLYGEGVKRAFARLRKQIQEEMGLDHATSSWQQALDTERALRAIVSIRFSRPRFFGMEQQGIDEATGFVVDAQRGYILTSQYVVGFGPFVGYAVFENFEECDVTPVYRDPVHDFGILRFDPKAIKNLVLEQLSLRPDQAKIGASVRVIGRNRRGDLSIQTAAITRMDLNSPSGLFGSDMNYIQTTTDAYGTGGPVVNNEGHAVALSPGENRGPGFLPLDRPLRALESIINGHHISRGTLQTRWCLSSLAECRRLGLDQNTEMRIRKQFPRDTRMIIVSSVLPAGPGDQKVFPGDILVKVNGEFLLHFSRLDEILDSSIGGTVSLTISRGGNELQIQLPVDDLHALTPDRYVHVAGSTFQQIPFQEAHRYGVAAKGVYVALAYGSFRSAQQCSLVESINGQRTPDLEAFTRAISEIPDKAQIVVRYRQLSAPSKVRTSVLRFRRELATAMQLAVRNDNAGIWDFKELPESQLSTPSQRQSGAFVQLETNLYPAAAELVRSFTRVTFEHIRRIEGVIVNPASGLGLIVNAEKGLIVVARSVVAHDFCNIKVTIAESIMLEAKVVFLHPNANYAVIQYDPDLVDAPVKSAQLSGQYINQGRSTIFIGVDRNRNVQHGRTHVTAITTLSEQQPDFPRYRAFNLEAIEVDSTLTRSCGQGVLANENGTVDALWLTYGAAALSTFGMATPSLASVINQISLGVSPTVRIIDAELKAISMYSAKLAGVQDHWIRRVMDASPRQHHLLQVRKASFPLHMEHEGHTLLDDDIILSIEGQLITRPRDLDPFYDREMLQLRIVREAEEMDIQIFTVSSEDMCTKYILEFCGAVLHEPHQDARQDMSKLHSRIYIGANLSGSPADMYGLDPQNFITAINDKRVHTLEELRAEALRIPDNTYFRIGLISLARDTKPWVATAKKNEHYFPMYEYVRTSVGNWTKKKVEAPRSTNDCDSELSNGTVGSHGPEIIVPRDETGAGERAAPEGLST